MRHRVIEVLSQSYPCLRHLTMEVGIESLPMPWGHSSSAWPGKDFNKAGLSRTVPCHWFESGLRRTGPCHWLESNLCWFDSGGHRLSCTPYGSLWLSPFVHKGVQRANLSWSAAPIIFANMVRTTQWRMRAGDLPRIHSPPLWWSSNPLYWANAAIPVDSPPPNHK
ncbi:hypothetical protein RRG08_027746 [Elysia crispata]|uniref:Uncharacterized protein n=1 Tax=Elysia crispata TaxID=231223 RepID=A0AAE1CVN2_9GAST|nr:hypothetical protein RRG08_027746 [Elysia crispata]